MLHVHVHVYTCMMFIMHAHDNSNIHKSNIMQTLKQLSSEEKITEPMTPHVLHKCSSHWASKAPAQHLNLNHTRAHTHTCQDQGVRFICAGIAEQQEGLCVLNLSSNGISPDGIHHVSAMLVRKYLLYVMCIVHVHVMTHSCVVCVNLPFIPLLKWNVPLGLCYEAFHILL